MKMLFYSILLLPVGALSLSTNCPEGWVDGLPYGLGCLLFDFETTRTWNEAQEFCNEMDGAFLVEILSSPQQEYLESVAYEIEVTTGKERSWGIGVTDIGSEGDWWWAHSHSLVTFTAWGPGQPDNNNHEGVVENYGCLWHVAGYKWNDVGYSATLGTICQRV